MDLSKIVKLDLNKIKVGTEIWDCKYRIWHKVIRIIEQRENFVDFDVTEGSGFNFRMEKGKPISIEPFMRLTAMKVHLEAEDIPTIEKESNMNSFYVFRIDKKEKWKTKNSYYSSERFGTKHYTRTNAELVAKILNNKEA